jgi:hypothetical protein
MKENNIQSAWQTIESKIQPETNEELNNILKRKSKKIMKKFLLSAGVSGIISLGVIVFLIIATVNRWEDVYYRTINFALSLIILVSFGSAVNSFLFLLNAPKNIPLKQAITKRKEKIAKWLSSKLPYFILPVICMLLMLSIHVYFEQSPFSKVITSEESFFGLLLGLAVGLTVAFFTMKKIRAHQYSNLKYLDDLLKQIE